MTKLLLSSFPNRSFLQNFTRQSKFTYGLVIEEVTTRDESSHISATGQRVLPNGGISADGPPTTLSGTGIDRLAFLQANITRDNTKYVNGTIVGQRNVFQVRSIVCLSCAVCTRIRIGSLEEALYLWYHGCLIPQGFVENVLQV